MLKYPLTAELPACTEEEINQTFEYMDAWRKDSASPFTFELLYEIFPQYSGREAEVIFKSWNDANANR